MSTLRNIGLQVKVTTPPVVEPVVRPEIRNYMRSAILDGAKSLEDKEIDGMIITARIMLEKYLGLSFITQTRQQYYEVHGSRVELYYGPTQSISSVTETDKAGGTPVPLTAPTDYRLSGLDHKILDFNMTFSVSRGYYKKELLITHIAGYGVSASAVPEDIKLAIKKQVLTDFRHREKYGEPVMALGNDAKATAFHLSRNNQWG